MFLIASQLQAHYGCRSMCILKFRTNQKANFTGLDRPRLCDDTDIQVLSSLISSMGSAILSLQTKLDGLTALIQESDGHQTATNTMNPVNGAPTTLATAATVPANGPEANSVSNNHGYQPSQGMTRPSLHAPCVARSPAVSCRTARHFYGPTSPYFSLNVAQNKVSDKTSPKARESTERLPSIDQDDSDGDEMEDDNASHISPSSCRKTSTGHGVNVMPWADLFKLPFHLTLQEAVRLLEVYQEVVGEFHPILDITFLTHLAERWYAWSRSGAADIGKAGSSDVGDEDSYLALILVIAIALRAENTLPQSQIFKQIHNSCCANVNAKLVSPATTVTDVVIALLAVRLLLSYAHFTTDNTIISRLESTGIRSFSILLGKRKQNEKKKKTHAHASSY